VSLPVFFLGRKVQLVVSLWNRVKGYLAPVKEGENLIRRDKK
jgi:hypothetical protein